jgi:hypothetical protein
LYLEGAPSRFSADEGEAQESEGLRSADAALLAFGGRTAAELNQAGLARMERQRECPEPLTQCIEESTGVILMLEACYQIICVADDDHVAAGLLPSPAFGPPVEQIGFHINSMIAQMNAAAGGLGLVHAPSFAVGNRHDVVPTLHERMSTTRELWINVRKFGAYLA